MKADYQDPSFPAIEDLGGGRLRGLVTTDSRPVTRIGKSRYMIADIDPDRQVLLP